MKEQIVDAGDVVFNTEGEVVAKIDYATIDGKTILCVIDGAKTTPVDNYLWGEYRYIGDGLIVPRRKNGRDATYTIITDEDGVKTPYEDMSAEGYARVVGEITTMLMYRKPFQIDYA